MPTSTYFNLSTEKQSRIFDAAVKEFGIRNLDEGKLSNIIKDAGISRGSLYQYFEDKEDLYIYIFDKLRSERAEYTKPAFSYYKKKPFLSFFKQFYLLDSEFLLMHPSHIELGKKLYGASDSISRGLIKQLQHRYSEIFHSAIEYDKERGLIFSKIQSSALSDLCVHFVTDIFIFQSIHTQFSMMNIREHYKQTFFIIENGIAAKSSPPPTL